MFRLKDIISADEILRKRIEDRNRRAEHKDNFMQRIRQVEKKHALSGKDWIVFKHSLITDLMLSGHSETRRFQKVPGFTAPSE